MQQIQQKIREDASINRSYLEDLSKWEEEMEAKLTVKKKDNVQLKNESIIAPVKVQPISNNTNTHLLRKAQELKLQQEAEKKQVEKHRQGQKFAMFNNTRIPKYDFKAVKVIDTQQLLKSKTNMDSNKTNILNHAVLKTEMVNKEQDELNKLIERNEVTKKLDVMNISKIANIPTPAPQTINTPAVLEKQLKNAIKENRFDILCRIKGHCFRTLFQCYAEAEGIYMCIEVLNDELKKYTNESKENDRLNILLKLLYSMTQVNRIKSVFACFYGNERTIMNELIQNLTGYTYNNVDLSAEFSELFV